MVLDPVSAKDLGSCHSLNAKTLTDNYLKEVASSIITGSVIVATTMNAPSMEIASSTMFFTMAPSLFETFGERYVMQFMEALRDLEKSGDIFDLKRDSETGGFYWTNKRVTNSPSSFDLGSISELGTTN